MKSIVRPLFHALTRSGISVWIDEGEVIWGDSIMERINECRNQVKVAIIVFSPSFIEKSNWGKHKPVFYPVND